MCVGMYFSTSGKFLRRQTQDEIMNLVWALLDASPISCSVRSEFTIKAQGTMLLGVLSLFIIDGIWVSDLMTAAKTYLTAHAGPAANRNIASTQQFFLISLTLILHFHLLNFYMGAGVGDCVTALCSETQAEC